MFHSKNLIFYLKEFMMKKLLTLILVLVLVSVTRGTQYLTINGQSLNSITLGLDEICTIEVVSGDGTPYMDRLELKGIEVDALILLETRPEAGGDATVTIESRTSYALLAEGPGIAAGVHFVFQLAAREPGVLEIELWESGGVFPLDSIEITVTEPESAGAVFTYQGRLDKGGPANGFYDLVFKIYRSLNADIHYDAVTKEEVGVYDGYFTVELDFVNDPNLFNGEARWLEVGVRPGEQSDPCEYTILSPRQEVKPTPYAIYANKAFEVEGGVGIKGSGTVNYLPKFTGPTNLDNSVIYDDGYGNIGIGTSSPGERVHVYTPSGSAYIKNEAEIGNAYFLADGALNSGLQMRENGVVKAYVFWNATNERLTLYESDTDSLVVKGGKIGIGTTEPDDLLHVSRYTSGSPGIRLTNSNMLGGDFSLRVGGPASGVGTGNLAIYDHTTSETRLVVDPTGDVGIGTTNPNSNLHIKDDESARVKFDHSGSTTWLFGSSALDNECLSVVETGTTRLRFYPGGDMVLGIGGGSVGIGTYKSYTFYVEGSAAKPGGGTWTDSSDERLKKNIKVINGQEALDKLTRLQGVTFEWINPTEQREGVRAGVVAQQLEEVFPDWVEEVEATGKDKELLGEDEKVKAVSFPHDFNAYLIEALKEQQKQIELLQDEVKALKAQIQIKK